MKILLVVDGSLYSDISTRTLEALRLTPETEVTVMTVVPEHAFLGGITLDKLRGTDRPKKAEQEQKAAELLEKPVQVLSDSGISVESLVLFGNPGDVILKTARERGVSLVVMGAKGLTDPLAFRLGSVAQKVVKYAGCSVLLARRKAARAGRDLKSGDNAADINRVLLATDGSKYSDSVTQFLIDLPLPQHCQVTVVTALQSYAAALVSMPTLDLQTNQQLLADLREAEEKEARKITAKSEGRLKDKGYKTASAVIRGGPGESILKAARRHDADIIALGSRGLTGMEAFLLGSVSERVARYATCSVLVVRPSKR